jgi:hypothetical protein
MRGGGEKTGGVRARSGTVDARDRGPACRFAQFGVRALFCMTELGEGTQTPVASDKSNISIDLPRIVRNES